MFYCQLYKELRQIFLVKPHLFVFIFFGLMISKDLDFFAVFICKVRGEKTKCLVRMK